MELIIVLAVIAVLGAVIIPILYNYVELGREANRMNIARTLYLAAQNQLTDLYISKGLDSVLVEEGIDPNDPDLLVYHLLGQPEAWHDDPNKNDIRFVSKSMGTAPSGLINRLLNPAVLEKSILFDAILIEFNTKTGKVVSVFYSERNKDGFEFSYNGTDRSCISGVRGMGPEGYEPLALARKQGYYGVKDSGSPEVPDFPVIGLYDGYIQPLDAAPYKGNENILYAGILIPIEMDGDFNLLINGTIVDREIVDIFIEPYVPSHPGYTGYTWILDYIDSDGRKTVGIEKYADYFDVNENFNVGISLKGAGISVESNYWHPYYDCDKVKYSGEYGIVTARHLYNIRHEAGASFLQKNDIRLADSGLSEVNTFIPVPVFGGRYDGNEKHISNLNADTLGDAGLFARIASGGEVLNLTLVNPSIRGSGYAGSVCGVNEGKIDAAYIKYDEYKYIRGSAGAGGITGVNNGTIRNTTFISPLPAVHIAGGIAGGITGANSGVISEVLFLALAPKNDGYIIPIAEQRGAEVTNARYLSGRYIRPNEQEITSSAAMSERDGYNREDSLNNLGDAYSTWEMYTKVKGWAKYPSLTEVTVLNPDNPAYPYPFAATRQSALPSNPGWPIVDAEIATAKLVYYEIYSDRTWGYEDGLPSRLKNGIVIHDGYALQMSFTKGEYHLLIGENDYTVSLKESGAAKTVEIRDQVWPYKIEKEVDDQSNGAAFSLWIFIPNSIIEPVFVSEGSDIAVALTYRSEEIIRRVFNPVFAPPSAGYIRSPRHLNNIGLTQETRSNVYTQQLDLDFSGYYKELSTTLTPNADPRLQNLSSALVAGVFTGSYNGNGLLIRNLKITAPAVNDTGMFGLNQGVVYNVTMKNANITGRNNTGSIAGQNAGSIYSIILDNPHVAGNDYTGGITGQNAGSINNIILDNPQVYGNDYTGGITGKNMKIIYNVTAKSLEVSGNSFAGGITGLNEGGTVGQGSGTTGRGLNISLLEPTVSGNNGIGGIAGRNNGIITDSRVYSDTVSGRAEISGNSYVGGIAGENLKTIQYSFIGIIDKPRSTSMKPAVSNYVLGKSYTGGIAGSTEGTINICYVDYTRVGKDSTATYTGGIAGHLAGGSITNVFYNYGNSDPQDFGFGVTINGAAATTGGLVGYISAGTLANSYSDAYFYAADNLLIGGKAAAVPNVPASVLYLKVPGYSSRTPSTGGTARDATTPSGSLGQESLRHDTAITTYLGAGGNASYWQMGPGAKLADARTFTYPYLAAFGIPQWWPLPEPSQARLAYYEKYLYINPKTGGNYGLWFGSENDTLDYSEDQVILEDGYVVLASVNTGMHFITVRDMYGNNVHSGNGQLGHPVTITLGSNYSGYILPLSTLEGYARHAGNLCGGLYPLQVMVGRNQNGNDIFDGYLNPLFAKSIFGANQINNLGTTVEARMARFEEQGDYYYIIRTPRHLKNIGFVNGTGAAGKPSTLNGKYLQEVSIDFAGLNTPAGYWRNDSLGNTAPGSSTRVNMDIRTGIVPGTFLGVYTAESHYTPEGEYDRTGAVHIRNIKNIGSTTGLYGQVINGPGIFESIGAGGVVENIYLLKNTITSLANNSGGLAGISSGNISNIRAYKISVKGVGNVGGIVGYADGPVTDSGVMNSEILGTADNVGGIAGFAPGPVTGARVINSSIRGTADNVGGIAGFAPGPVTGSSVIDSDIWGTGDNVGGIVGQGDDVSSCSVENSTVQGVNY